MIPEKSLEIELWRTKPILRPLGPGDKRFPLKYVFPSGRQAIPFSITRAGLNRINRVGFPEWSSNCVLIALGGYVTPVPMKEAVEKNIKLDGILLYEQWGWPFPQAIWDRLADKYSRKVIIWDRVDSIDSYLRREKKPHFKFLVEIISLSKLLGVQGGGLALYNSEYLEFKAQEKSLLTDMLIYKKLPSRVSEDISYKKYFQNQDEAISPNAAKWLNENSLKGAMEKERQLRQGNLAIIQEKGFSAGWPEWMKDALKKGSTPGIIPLMRNRDPEDIRKAAGILGKTYGIRSSVYHFNWTGDPFRPLYGECLAFPVHGMVKPALSQEIFRDLRLLRK
jgi:hypothetical protein